MTEVDEQLDHLRELGSRTGYLVHRTDGPSFGLVDVRDMTEAASGLSEEAVLAYLGPTDVSSPPHDVGDSR
jgi:hypothetical protein